MTSSLSVAPRPLMVEAQRRKPFLGSDADPPYLCSGDSTKSNRSRKKCFVCHKAPTTDFSAQLRQCSKCRRRYHVECHTPRLDPKDNEPTWRCQMYIEARGMEIHDGFRAMKRKPSRSPTSSIRQLNLKPDGHASIFKKQRTDGPSPSLRTPDLTWSRGTPVSDAMWSSDNKEEGMNCLEGAMGPLREHVSLDKGALSRVHRMQSFSSNTRLGGVHIQSNSFSVKKENKAARWQTGGRSLFKHGPLPNALSGPTQSRTDRGSRDNAPRGPAHVDTNRGLPPNVPREPSHPVLMAERPLKVSRGPLGPGADQPKTYTPSVHLENNLLAKPAPLPSSKRQTPPTEMSLRPTFESTASNGTNSITDLTGENTLTTSSQTKIQDPVGIQTAPAGTETRRSSEKQSPRGHQTIDDLLQGVQCRMPIQQNPFLIDQRSEDPHQGEVSATTDLLPTGQGAPSIDQEPRSVHRDHHGTGEGDHDSVDLSSKQFKIRTQKSVASISSLRSDPIMPPDVDENKLLQRSNQEAEDHKIKCKHLEAIISQLKKEHGRKIRKKDDELERKVKAFAKERENACKRFNTLQVETTELRRRQKSVPNPENQQTQSLEVYNLRHEVDRLNDLLKSEKSFKPRERRDLEESFKREKDVLQQESVRLSRHIQWQKKTWAREKKELEESLQSSKGASEKQRGPQNHADAQEELAWTQERQRLRRSLERQDETLNEQYQTILRLKNRASDQQSLCQRLQGRVSDLEQKLRVPQTQIGEASTAENVNGLLGCSLIPGTPTVLEAGGEMASLQMDLVHLSNEKQALRAENTSLKDELAALKDSAHGRPKAPVSCIAHMDLSTGLPLNLLPIDYKAKQEEICQRPRPKQVAQRKPTSIDRRMPHTHTVEYRPPLARNQKTDQGSLRSALGLPTRSRRPMLLKEVRIPSSDVQPESSTEDTSSQETTVKETRLDGNDRRRSQGDDRSIADSEDSQSDNTSPVRDASKASAPRDNRNCGVYDLLQEQLSLPTLMPRVVDNELAFSERKKDRHGRDVRNQPSFKIRKVPRGRWNQ